jgi:GT2 family glycosyltransferase
MDKSTKKLAVIILNWNGFNDSKKCINSVMKQLPKNASVYVLDNGSEINEAEKLTQEFNGSISIFRSETNLGFTGGCNYLVKIARANNYDYYLFLNNDAEIGPSFFDEMLNTMKNNNKIGILSPVIYSAQNHNKVIDSGGQYSWLAAKFKQDTYKPSEIKNASFITGCSMLLRSKVIYDSTVFDDRFFAYFEDAALCTRVLKLGYELKITPEASIYHEVAASSGKESAFKTYLMSRNRILFVKYYLPLIYRFYFFPFSTAKLLIAFLYFPLKKRPDRAKAFWRGYYHGWTSRTGVPKL